MGVCIVNQEDGTMYVFLSPDEVWLVLVNGSTKCSQTCGNCWTFRIMGDWFHETIYFIRLDTMVNNLGLFILDDHEWPLFRTHSAAV